MEELTELPECTTIYLTRAMRRRTKSEALRAAREVVLQLRMSGLHVSTVHTDRAREFSSLVFKEWLAESGLRHTRTSGGEPAGNSTAELGVRWAKNRVRALLKAAKAEARDWPLAISQASSAAWAKAFPYSPPDCHRHRLDKRSGLGQRDIREQLKRSTIPPATGGKRDGTEGQQWMSQGDM